MIILIRQEVGGEIVQIKTTEACMISGSLEVRVGGVQSWIGTLTPVRDAVCWKGNKMVVHWGL